MDTELVYMIGGLAFVLCWAVFGLVGCLARKVEEIGTAPQRAEKERQITEKRRERDAKIFCPQCHQVGHVKTAPLMDSSQGDTQVFAACANCGSTWHFTSLI